MKPLILLIIILIIIIAFFYTPINLWILRKNYEKIKDNDDIETNEQFKNVGKKYARHFNGRQTEVNEMIENFYERYNINLKKYVPKKHVTELDNIYRQIDLINVMPDRFIDPQILLTPVKSTKINNKQKKLVEQEQRRNLMDVQNVHDTGISKSFEANVDILKSKINLNYLKNPIRRKKMFEEIENLIKNNENAMVTYNKIKHENKKLIGVELTETDLLQLVYERINAPENIENRKNLKEKLVNALADSTENNYTVCAVGRSRNLLTTFAFSDSDDKLGKMISTTDIIELMGNKIMSEGDKLVEDPDGTKKINDLNLQISKEYKDYLTIPKVKRYKEDAFKMLEELL